MATKTTESIFNDSDAKTSWGTWTKYFSFPISTINSALNNTSNVPANAKITGVTINVSVRYEVSGSARVYFKYGIGGNGSISNELLSENQIGSTSTKGSETQSKSLPIGSSLSPFSISTANGDYFTICIYTSNNLPKTFWVDSVTLTITYEIPTYTVTWKNHDGTVLETDTGVANGSTPTYNGSTPTKASTAQYSYKFSGWSPTVGAISGNTTYTAQFTATLRSYTITVTAGTGGTVSGGGTYQYGKTATLKATPNTGYKFVKWSDGNTSATRTVTVTGTATYTATFEKLKYTVTWKNDDGTVLETDNNVEYGATPTYNGATPTKSSTAQHLYTFSGWSPAISAVTGNVTYTAQFTATVRKYTVKWYNYDGTLLETDTDVPYGTKPTYNGATPTKPSDDYYNYGFAGWSPSISEGIQGDKNFTAQFAQTDRYYTVRWVNASAEQGVEGALLETDEVKFNTQPDYNGAIPKHPKQDTDPALNYDFIGWSAKVTDPAKPDTELEKVKGDITYTAIYETTPKLYAITVVLFNSQSTDIYEYGTELTIESPEIVDFHRFVKWSDGDTRRSRPVMVTGEATYSAEYERIPIPIKANIEQVTGCYMVPDTNTIVYVINGTVPTVKIGRESVDGWSFLVSNAIPENGYPLKKLFITDNSGVTTRVY